ncbi:uncharacterized protein LOC123561766 [Mercenaria mercenaria]|uniref:uncharacterized protein LOC123561766 n=1 Tax=Mercenaria mercenaria TaxID=6596 RepID=UPI00234EE436|nr:uncharacterized protein LOC123561766 [Mercenaria mercenaria]
MIRFFLKMEANFRDLYDTLKAHSEQVSKWMSHLKQMKAKVDGETGFKLGSLSTWPVVSSFYHQKARQNTKNMNREEETSPKSRNSGKKNDEDTVALKIQDTKAKIKALEYNVASLLEQMDKSIPITPDKEKKSLQTVQIYDRDGYAANFVSSFTQKFQSQFIITKIQKLADIDSCKPLMILCQSRSRLQPDLDYAVEEFTNLKDLQAAIVVIHCKEEHALPQMSSKMKVSGERKYQNLSLIDVAFTEELKFYECEMNSEALKRLADFVLKKDSTSV